MFSQKRRQKYSLALTLGGLAVGLLLSNFVFAAANPKPANPKPANSKPSYYRVDRPQAQAQSQAQPNYRIEDNKSREIDPIVIPVPGKGHLASNGAFRYSNPKDDNYWVALSGVLRLDETLFSGRARDRVGIPSTAVGFPSGGNVRKALLELDGGIGPGWEYTFSVNFAGGNVAFEDVWVAYDGFLACNEIFIGQVPGYYYGIDNSNSTTWMPFLERSLAANAFYPGDGLGVMTDFFGDCWGLTLVASQPVHSAFPDVTHDRWRGIARLTVAPLYETGHVLHFGISGNYRDNDEGLRSGYATTPSARARNTAQLVNTAGTGVVLLSAQHAWGYALEAAYQCGPFMLEGEYQGVRVDRFNTRTKNKFYGWMVQTRYLLTGGSHEYDVRDGNFGKVTCIPDTGAWEVAARYDMINLNDRDILGGRQYDASVAVNWYVNELVRLSANYIRANIYPFNNAPRRTLDILGMRVQVRFK